MNKKKKRKADSFSSKRTRAILQANINTMADEVVDAPEGEVTEGSTEEENE